MLNEYYVQYVLKQKNEKATQMIMEKIEIVLIIKIFHNILNTYGFRTRTFDPGGEDANVWLEYVGLTFMEGEGVRIAIYIVIYRWTILLLLLFFSYIRGSFSLSQSVRLVCVIC
jgi:hypothetical protein